MTLEELQAQLELWKSSFPKLVRRGLQKGASILKEDIKRQYDYRISWKRGRHLKDGLTTKVTLNPLKALVAVEPKQQYKAQTNEYGKTIEPKTPSGWLMIHDMLGIRKVKSVTIPARPVFEPTLERRQADILAQIEYAIIEGFGEGKTE